MKPVVALSMGDPAGIGPEIAAAAAADPRVRRACRPVLVGSREAFGGLRRGPPAAPVVDPGAACRRRAGAPDAAGGRASFEAFRLGLQLALRGLAGALVTAPSSKLGWSRAGIAYRDHTEFLEKVLGRPDCAMMLLCGRLRAVLATRHIPLKDVGRRLDAAAVERSALAARDGLRELGFRRPRIALCALNPHAGENGLLGSEESFLLAPAVARLRGSGVDIRGPLPADAAWSQHRGGRFDALVALYHDQALIPLKTADPRRIVNWTVGLPVVRTSPGHGTAFDIAGTGRADPEAMIQATLLAARLARARASA